MASRRARSRIALPPWMPSSHIPPLLSCFARCPIVLARIHAVRVSCLPVRPVVPCASWWRGMPARRFTCLCAIRPSGVPVRACIATRAPEACRRDSRSSSLRQRWNSSMSLPLAWHSARRIGLMTRRGEGLLIARGTTLRSLPWRSFGRSSTLRRACRACRGLVRRCPMSATDPGRRLSRGLRWRRACPRATVGLRWAR